MSIYNITVKDSRTIKVKLEKYRGKVLLIVNTATRCALTPQYEALEQLFKKYKDKGFMLLDFPSNQFANNTPENNEEIAAFCEVEFGTTFDRFDKIDVNGENESPLFTFLKNAKKGFFSKKIKWNFTKFLVDREGNVVKRFGPTVKPEKIAKHIEKLL